MIKQIELLVHAGAPSGRKDDDKYKAQAESYCAFSGRRISLDAPSDERAHSPRGREQNNSRDNQDDITVNESPTVFLDDTQLAITGLESQLLTSSLPLAREERIEQLPEDERSLPSISGVVEECAPRSDDAISSPARAPEKRKWQEEEHGASHRSDPGLPHNGRRNSNERHTGSSSNPSLSSYLKTPILDRSAKKRRLTDKGNGIPALPTFAAATGNEWRVVANVPKRRSVFREQTPPAATAPAAITCNGDSLAVSEPTSELPTSYSLSDITTESSRPRTHVSQRSASDSNLLAKATGAPSSHVDSSTVSGSSGSRSIGNSGRTKVPARDNQQAGLPVEVIVIADDTQTEAVQAKARDKERDAVEARPPITCIEDRAAQPTRLVPVSAASAEALQILKTLSTSIHAPEPEISIKRFTTHITPALASLASNPDMAGRYVPASVSRDLRPLERGHWLFDASTLPVERHVKLWQFLEQAITNGGPGWGIWCERDGGLDRLGAVKVYCWGEVVKHVYLLLYVGSSSQIRKLGARWVDAEERVVVQMKQAGV